jgi:hypothetical protein
VQPYAGDGRPDSRTGTAKIRIARKSSLGFCLIQTMPKLYLHVGAGKTGTSYLQAQCTLLHEKLAAIGLWYPITDQLLRRVKAGKVTSGNTVELLPWFCPQHSKVRKQGLLADPKQLGSWVDKQTCLAEGRNILLSSETMQFADRERVSVFADIVASRGYEVTILFYGRHALDHAISNYREHLQRGLLRKREKDEPVTLDSYIAKNVVPFAHTLKIYSQVFPDSSIIVKSYDYAKSDLLANFLSTIGVHGLSGGGISGTNNDRLVVNRSLSVVEMRYMELASELLDPAQIAYLGSLLVTAPPCEAASKGPTLFKIGLTSLDSFKRRHVTAFADINSRWSPSLEQPLEVIPADFVNNASEVQPESLLNLSFHALALSLRPSRST